MRSSVFSSFLPPFFFLDGFSDVFPFCSPGPMRSSAFSSFPPPLFFLCLRWIFSPGFPFLLPRLDANQLAAAFLPFFFFHAMDFQYSFPFMSPGLMQISLQQICSPFFFLRWIFGCLPLLLPGRMRISVSSCFPLLFFFS